MAELSAGRIGFQFKLVRDDLEVLKGIPSIQTADIADNPRFTALLAAMLRNNDQLFSLYVGYDDGSFIEMDAIEGARRETRARLEAPDQAAFRLVIISRADPVRIKSRRLFLSDKLETIRELPGPLDYDPRERPWYKDAGRRDGTWLTGPYVFFATGKQGYTVQLALEQGSVGVVAGDLLLDATQELLKQEQLTPSAVAFMFDDDNRILAHPKMSEMMGRRCPVPFPACVRRIWPACSRRSAPGERTQCPNSSFGTRQAGCMPRPFGQSLIQVRPSFMSPSWRRSTSSSPISFPSAGGCSQRRWRLLG